MSIQLNRRLLYIPVLQIDTNLINALQKLPAVNQLEKWFEDEVILINISGTARSEAIAVTMSQELVKRINKFSQQLRRLSLTTIPFTQR